MDTETTVISAVAIAGAVRMIIWAARSLLPDKFVPIVAIALGVVLAVAAVSQFSQESIITAIVLGVMAGGTAVASHEVQEQLRK